MILASADKRPRFEVVHAKNEKRDQLHEEFVVEDLVDVRGWKAMGYKLSIDKYKEIRWLESLAVLVEDELVIDIPDLHHETEEGDGEATENNEIQESESGESETNHGGKRTRKYEGRGCPGRFQTKKGIEKRH